MSKIIYIISDCDDVGKVTALYTALLEIFANKDSVSAKEVIASKPMFQ